MDSDVELASACNRFAGVAPMHCIDVLLVVGEAGERAHGFPIQAYALLSGLRIPDGRQRALRLADCSCCRCLVLCGCVCVKGKLA